MLNPTDMLLKGSRGDVRPGMTVRDLLAQIGVRPEDPVERLREAIEGQKQNASMMGKAETLGAGAPQQAPQGLGALMGGMNGGQSTASPAGPRPRPSL